MSSAIYPIEGHPLEALEGIDGRDIKFVDSAFPRKHVLETRHGRQGLQECRRVPHRHRSRVNKKWRLHSGLRCYLNFAPFLGFPVANKASIFYNGTPQVQTKCFHRPARRCNTLSVSTTFCHPQRVPTSLVSSLRRLKDGRFLKLVLFCDSSFW